MAKTASITTIDGVQYSLHSTKSSGDNVPIGLVPVLASNKIEDFIDIYPESLVVSCLKSGLAVYLQAKARRSVDSKKPTDSEINAIAGRLLSEGVEKYKNNYSQLQKDALDEWQDSQEDRTFDADKVWNELKNG